MDLCLECKIRDKLANCCREHPISGESIRLTLENGRVVWACPELTPSGDCGIYDSRPEECRDYLCPKFYEEDLD